MTYVAILTFLHTAVSFVAIGIGIPAVASLYHADRYRRWRRPFVIAAAITTLSGFIFPFIGFTPAFLTGIVATVILAGVLFAERQPPGRGWRRIYAGGMVASLYLLIFVLIAQAFLKVPALKALAPTGAEPAFAITQLATLVLFILIGFAALRAFGRPAAVTVSSRGMRRT